MKKILTLTFIILFGLVSAPAFAAGCIGNVLEGTLTTETGGLVYLSAASWDAAFPGDPSSIPFESYYDSANPSAPFSGQAWSETFGWLIFTGSTAYFQEPNNQPNLWGGWDGTMDLSGITLTGSTLTGTTTSIALTGGAINDTDDWWVGAGEIDFSGASLTGTTGSGCDGEVNLFVNNLPSYNQTGSCPVTDVVLTWTTSDITNCTTGSGPWSPSGTRATQELVGEATSVSVGNGDILLFTLNCVDTGGTTVTGSASVSCNDNTVPGNGGNGTITIPDFIET